MEETSILKSISILVVFSYILFSLVLLLHLPFLNFFAEFVDTSRYIFNLFPIGRTDAEFETPNILAT